MWRVLASYGEPGVTLCIAAVMSLLISLSVYEDLMSNDGALHHKHDKITVLILFLLFVIAVAFGPIWNIGRL